MHSNHHQAGCRRVGNTEQAGVVRRANVEDGGAAGGRSGVLGVVRATDIDPAAVTAAQLADAITSSRPKLDLSELSPHSSEGAVVLAAVVAKQTGFTPDEAATLMRARSAPAL